MASEKPAPSARTLASLLAALAAAALVPLACTSILGDFEVKPSAGAGGSQSSSVASSSGKSSVTATAASSGSTSTTVGAGGGDGGPPPSPDCVAYCDAITKNCMGMFAQYTTNADCLAVCKFLPTVPPTGAGGAGGGASSATSTGSGGAGGGMTNVDTLGCRTALAMDAAADQSFCPIAGPAGNDACGAACDAYCDLEMAACSGLFKTIDDCHTACDLYPNPPAYDLTQKSGHSFGCRMYWLTQAAADASLCPKSGLASDVCKCGDAADCETCFACALGPSSKCGDLFNTCLNDVPCSQCSSCFQQCKDSPGCLTMCDAANAAGCAKYDTLLNCVYCDQCATAVCADQKMQEGWVCK